MRTNFSQAQLSHPEIAEANGILETCVHLGFCTNTCPTYVVTRDENDSPRGRIDLIRAGAFYGPSAAAVEPQIQRVRDHFGRSGKARYIEHEEAQGIPPLQVAINAFSGIPSLGELGLLKWRPGGGNTWFLPERRWTEKSPTNSSVSAAASTRTMASIIRS